MKLKVVIPAVTIPLLIVAFLLQVSFVRAQTGDEPITGPEISPTPTASATPSASPSATPAATPTSTPTSSPSATPTPTPATFNLSGTVMERGFFGRGEATGAANVTVLANGLFTGTSSSTQTDSNGNYSMNLPKGKYFVKAVDPSAVMSVPVLRMINLNFDKSNVNFTDKTLNHP